MQENSQTLVAEINPEQVSFVERIKIKQSEEMQLCELEITMSSVEFWLPKDR